MMRRSGCLLPTLLVLLATCTQLASAATKALPPRRVLSKYRKVRGDGANRRLQTVMPSSAPTAAASFSEVYGPDGDDQESKARKGSKTPKSDKSEDSSSGKGKGGGMSGKSKTKGSSTKSTASKSHASHKSQVMNTGTGGPKSSDHPSDNIFDHDEEDNVLLEIVPVDCGGDTENPFLSTFVVSIRLQPADVEIQRQQSRKGDKSSKKKSQSSEMIDVDDTEEEEQGGEPAEQAEEEQPVDGEKISNGDLLFVGLSPADQRDLEIVFKNVYNNLTYLGCDGFFRTVYSVSLKLVERDGDEEYAVTLQNTYRMDGQNETQVYVTNGTLTRSFDSRRLQEVAPPSDAPDSILANLFLAPEHRQGGANNSSDSNHTSAANPTKEEGDSPTTYVQMVSGGDDLPIYYVSLAATCRNCEVTEALNFPLLRLPEEDEYYSVSTMGTAAVFAQPRKEDECTCPLPVDESEEAIARRRLIQRRLDEEDLYYPPPSAPSPEEFLNAMNAAIKVMQETEGKLLRVAGLIDLIEPDYFQGEDPEQLMAPTPAPTISAMPSLSSVPSQSPTISPQPTITPRPTTESNPPTYEEGSDDFIPPGNGTDSTEPPFNMTELNTTAPTVGAVVTRRPTLAPATPRPTSWPTSAPTSSATKWVVSIWGLVVPALLSLI